MNEIRYWLPMSVAAWFSYKLILLGALGIVVFTRPPRFSLRIGTRSGGRPYACVAAAGALVTAAYFGIPAMRGILTDAWWFHYPAVALIQDMERFPIPAAFALDDPLYYHLGPDILAATWAQLLDLKIQTGFVVNICIFAPASFLLAYGLVRRESRIPLAGIAAAAFLVAGGNLLFLRIRPADFGHPLSLLNKLNSQTVDGLLKMTFTPSHTCGVAAILVGIVILRHFARRPSSALAALLGLWLGVITLIAEWYFFPLIAAIAVVLARQTFHQWRASAPCRRIRDLALIRLLPLLVAVGWGFFNNSYVSGLFAHFWLGQPSIVYKAPQRLLAARLNPTVQDLQAPASPLPADEESLSISKTPMIVGAPANMAEPKWTPPPIIPLRQNWEHLGEVPSWGEAHSSGSSFIPIFGFRFFSECAPVMLLGLPLGLWLWRRRPGPVLETCLVFAIVSLLPPLVFDWGYRPAEFLRFFTGSYCACALLLGWGFGVAYREGPAWLKVGVVIVSCSVMVNPFLVGLTGLQRTTLAAVEIVNQRAGSLQKAAVAEGSRSVHGASDDVEVQQRRALAFEDLAEQARRFLYPLTQGRDRAIVVVPVDQVPPTEVFPDWMRLAPLARLQLPLGWHWQDTVYAAYYREAVTSLSPRSVTALDARWMVVSNLFSTTIPKKVRAALNDRRRFAFAASFKSGDFYLILFHALEYNDPSDTVN